MKRTALFALALVSCSPGGAALRADAPSANQALGEACGDVSAGGEPLVVDWRPEARGDLEIAMKEGVAVVGYSCDKLTLIKDCQLEGSYGYIGMTTREQVVRLVDSDEVRANLPFSGGAIAGELQRGTTLEVAMILVGKRRTTWSDPTTTDLKGNCAGATHYVSGATVGAFALDTGSRAKARAAAEVFGAGASAASASGKQVRNRDGDPGDCKNATPESSSPPPQCGAPIRLVLSPIAKTTADATAAPGAAPSPAAPLACPTGTVLAEGKCTTKAKAAVFQCRPGDATECSAQCEKGHAGSCATLGTLIARDAQGDAGKAVATLKQACSGGAAVGCTELGALLLSGRAGGMDAEGATRAFERACTLGEARGCGELGRLSRASGDASVDESRTRFLFEQGCSGGHAESCREAGAMALAGRGGPADSAHALALFSRACNGGDAEGCGALGELYEDGAPGVGRNPVAAQIHYKRGCFRGSARACVGAARAIQSGLSGDPAGEAKRLFERGCTGRIALACAALKVVYGDARPVFVDPQEKQALRKDCVAGKASACTAHALLEAAQGNTPFARSTFNRACSMGDKWACALGPKVQ